MCSEEVEWVYYQVSDINDSISLPLFINEMYVNAFSYAKLAV